MIHQPLSPDRVHPQVSSSLRLLTHYLVCHTLLFIYYFKELISFIDSLDKCHTSIFNTLISTIVMREKNIVSSTGKINSKKAWKGALFSYSQ